MKSFLFNRPNAFDLHFCLNFFKPAGAASVRNEPIIFLPPLHLIRPRRKISVSRPTQQPKEEFLRETISKPLHYMLMSSIAVDPAITKSNQLPHIHISYLLSALTKQPKTKF